MPGQEVLEEITVDDDDFSLEFLRELENSFRVTLPRDLRHIQTVGDLFEEVMGLRPPPERGDRCDSAMAYHAIRRATSAGQDFRHVTPSSRFVTLTNERPRDLAVRLERETGLRLPPIVKSGRLFLLALVLFVATWTLASYEQYAAALGSAVAMILIYRRDGGVWSGDWETLGSLSTAAAIRNVTGLTQLGARGREQDWWRSFVRLMLDTAHPTLEGKEVSRDRIGPETRFRWA